MMLTKEQRAEIRAKTLTDLQFDGELLLEWDSMTVSGLLDALDEMERSKVPPPAASAPELTDEILRARVTTQWRSDAKRWARQAGSEGAAASDLLAALLALDEMERERDALDEFLRLRVLPALTGKEAATSQEYRARTACDLLALVMKFATDGKQEEIAAALNSGRRVLDEFTAAAADLGVRPK